MPGPEVKIKSMYDLKTSQSPGTGSGTNASARSGTSASNSACASETPAPCF